MSWSWRIGRIAGIPINVHWTFLILIAWVLIDSWSRSQDPLTAVAGVGFIVVVFGCIVLHELGHALVVRHFGITTSDITLLPIGGVARLQRMPDRPSQELQVALAGPAVNVAIAVLLFFVFHAGFPEATDDAQKLVRSQFLPSLMAFNVIVVLFNLLPAFPMDGGRVLRAAPGDETALCSGDASGGLGRAVHGDHVRSGRFDHSEPLLALDRAFCLDRRGERGRHGRGAGAAQKRARPNVDADRISHGDPG